MTGTALPTRRTHRAMTLMELITVLGLMAVLAALLFPALFSARESARAANCLSNLKQLGSAWAMYTQDYDEMAPGGAFARFASTAPGATIDGHRYSPLWVLRQYTRDERVFVCPTTEGWNFSTNNPALDTHRPRVGSYATNYELVQKTDAAVSMPAAMILFCDSYNPWQDCPYNCEANCLDGCHSFIWDRIGRGCYQGDCTKPTDWHHSGVQVCFADGHAKHKKLGNIRYSEWILDLLEADPHFSQPISRDW